MAEIEIRLPKMGESVTEATITNWLKEVGDVVELDEPLVEVATDKVDNELPSEVEGTLVKICFEKDEVAQVGDVIAVISTDGTAEIESSSRSPKSEAPEPTVKKEAPQAEATISVETVSVEKTGPSGKFYSPLVRSIAEKEGISMAQLESISGSGENGRVTKRDILAFMKMEHLQQNQNRLKNKLLNQPKKRHQLQQHP